MMISVFVWKGFWDLFEQGLTQYLSVFTNTQVISLIASGLIGYGLYLALFLYQYMINVCKFNCIKVTLMKDFVYVITFVSVVAVWRFLWDGYDYLVLDTTYQAIIIVATHIGSFFLLFFFQLGTLLYGPGGMSSSSGSEEDCTVKEYLQVNDRVKFYDIEYFALQNS
jgi:hypothetical protein